MSRTNIRRFQFTPLREGRRRPVGELGTENQISIHAPPRGATSSRTSTKKRFLNFNSRPSARGDLAEIIRPNNGGVISIHAPPRGATVNFIRHNLCDYISIHAPPRGATLSGAFSCTALLFQFTPLREGRRLRNRRLAAPPKISIHAPPRGATYDSLDAAENKEISIHAPPRGATFADIF